MTEKQLMKIVWRNLDVLSTISDTYCLGYRHRELTFHGESFQFIGGKS